MVKSSKATKLNSLNNVQVCHAAIKGLPAQPAALTASQVTSYLRVGELLKANSLVCCSSIQETNSEGQCR